MSDRREFDSAAASRNIHSVRWLAVATVISAGFACGDDGAKPTAATTVDAAPAVKVASAPPPAAAPKLPPPDAAVPPPAAAASPTEPVSYPDTESGLSKLIADLLDPLDVWARQAEAARLVESLRLPDPDQWFRSRFGKVPGKKLAAEYGPISDDIGSLALEIRDAKRRGLRNIQVSKLSQAGDPGAVGYQVMALEKASTGTPLYSVRMRSSDGSQVFHVWSFVHEQGTFRFVGKMKALGSPRTSSGKDINEYTRDVAERLLAAEKAGGAGR